MFDHFDSQGNLLVHVQSGNSGFSGFSGVGPSGFSGYSGNSGTSGTSGTSGFSANTGPAGASGQSGISGISGVSGTSGTSGFSGWSGFTGQSGFSGQSGFTGQSGFSGYTGFSGQSGASGWSGFTGNSGFSSPSGYTGFSGQSGFTGTSGNSGASGTSGFSGLSGNSGSSGFSAALTNFATFSSNQQFIQDAAPSVTISTTLIPIPKLSTPLKAGVAYYIRGAVHFILNSQDNTTGIKYKMTYTGTSQFTNVELWFFDTFNDFNFMANIRDLAHTTPFTEISNSQFYASLVHGVFIPDNDGTLDFCFAQGSSSSNTVTVDSAFLECRVADGSASGASGFSGFSGTSGLSGTSGTSGTSGASAFSGASGFSGFSGTFVPSDASYLILNRTTGLSITPSVSTYTTVPMQTQVAGAGADLSWAASPNPSRVTVNTTGRYRIDWSFMSSSGGDGTGLRTQLLKNGTTAVGNYDVSASNYFDANAVGTQAQFPSVIADFVSGDYIELQAIPQDGTSNDKIAMRYLMVQRVAAGATGTSGYSGYTGYSGLSGISGTSGNPVSGAIKASDLSRTNTVTVTADPDLTVNLSAGHKYSFDCVLWFSMNGSFANGWQYGFNGTATASVFKASALNCAASVTSSNFTALNSSTGATGSVVAQIRIQGTLQCNGSGTFYIWWAQDALSATATTLQAGSYLLVNQLS